MGCLEGDRLTAADHAMWGRGADIGNFFTIVLVTATTMSAMLSPMRPSIVRV